MAETSPGLLSIGLSYLISGVPSSSSSTTTTTTRHVSTYELIHHPYLDIDEISPSVFAAGLPWRQRTSRSAHRNNIDELAGWLEHHYSGRYLVFNLASDDTHYSTDVFNNQIVEVDLVLAYPSLVLLARVACMIHYWLQCATDNIAILHCSNGIHRTATAFSAYALLTGLCDDATDALSRFAMARLHKTDAENHMWLPVTLRRYVRYFHELCYLGGHVPNSAPLHLHRIIIHHSSNELLEPVLEIRQNGRCIYNSSGDSVGTSDGIQSNSMLEFFQDVNTMIFSVDAIMFGDISMRCYIHGTCELTLFRFQFHTGFMPATLTRINGSHLNSVAHRLGDDVEVDLFFGSCTAAISKEEPVSIVLSSVFDSMEAFWQLISCHVVIPDGTGLRALTASGFSEAEAIFALQRANNSMLEAHAIAAEIQANRLKEENELLETQADDRQEEIYKGNASSGELSRSVRDPVGNIQRRDKLIEQGRVRLKRYRRRRKKVEMLNAYSSDDVATVINGSTKLSVETTTAKAVPSLIEYDGTGVPPPPPPPLPPSTTTKKRHGKTVKSKVHWQCVPEYQLQNTVWGGETPPSIADADDILLFEELFCADPQKSITKNHTVSSSPVMIRSFLPVRRANNIVIGLTRFKKRRLDNTALIEALRTQDEEVLSVEDVILLQKILPDADEIKAALREGTNDIAQGPAEQFVLAAARCGDLIVCADAMLFRLEFDVRISRLENDITVLKYACDEMRNSGRLRGLLHAVLGLGNLSNQYAGGNAAGGVRLQSLIRLKDVHSNKKDVTLLHFLVRLVKVKDPDVAAVPLELPHVHDASLVELGTLRSDVDKLINELVTFREYIPTSFTSQANESLCKLRANTNVALSTYTETARFFGEEDTKENIFVKFDLFLKEFIHLTTTYADTK